MSKSSIIDHIHTSRKEIAITFDDGPNPLYTLEILALFAEVAGKATFYMIGEQMKASPEVVKAVDEQGHEIGNHTWTHPFLSEISIAKCKVELESTDNLIKEMTGKSPLTFRPPYFAYNDEVAALSKKMGYKMIGASNMEAKDWDNPGVEHIIQKSLESVRDGSILIFHDGYEDRSQTVEAIRIILPKLTEEGYRLVTVSELLNNSLE